MSDEKFALPGSSYKELCKIIAAYSVVGGPTAPGPVSKVAGVHETIVSRNNKFLVSSGILVGGQKKSCTSLGLKLGRAIQHDQEDEIRLCWSEVISQTDFLEKIISAISIRKGMEESALASHIAFSAGSAKSGTSRAGAGAIIELLFVSGRIASDGGTYTALRTDPEASQDEGRVASSNLVLVPSSKHLETSLSTTRQASKSKIGADNPIAEEDGNVKLNINLNVSCAPGDLEELGRKLRKMVEDFQHASEPSPLNVSITESLPAQTEEEVDANFPSFWHTTDK